MEHLEEVEVEKGIEGINDDGKNETNFLKKKKKWSTYANIALSVSQLQVLVISCNCIFSFLENRSCKR